MPTFSQRASTSRRGGDPASRLRTARVALGGEAGAGNGGRAAVERFAAAFDQVLREVFAASVRPQVPVAVAALGGYGRRELCLHSDVDLLIIFEQPPGDLENGFLQDFLQPLWDLDLVLGHQVRTISDAAALEDDNPEFLVALLDARPLAGENALFDRFVSIFHSPATHRRVLAALLGLVEERHQRFNSTPYQLEPDVKEAPGGLRDVMATRAIAGLVPSIDLRHSPADDGRLEAAQDFLLRVRSVLHLRGGRNANVLTHDLQESVASALGYPGSQPQQRVEALMRDYFRHARNVHRSCEWAVRKARPAETIAPERVGHNLERHADGLRFIDRARAAADPTSWLDAFQWALDLGCSLSDELQADIRRNVDRFEPEDFYPTAVHRLRLLQFLRPRPGLYARLSEMHDCGLLGALFPEFRKITGRVTRDFFHRYTVDEHTLLTIHNLERLANPAPDDETAVRFGGLLEGIEAPELIVLAMLFHDVGKWTDGYHPDESQRLAEKALSRLHLSIESYETVEFLIQNHLQMSRVAFRRDSEDPEIVKRFAGLVGVEDRLKLLTLVTVVDIGAVAPDTLTPWKQDLLWRLYIDTYNELTMAYGDDLIEGNQRGLAGLLKNSPGDLSNREILEFVEGLPRRYLQTFPREVVYEHVVLARNIGPHDVHLTLDQKGNAWQLTVATMDKPLLFSNICGVLASFGMDILKGQAMTNPHGLVLDVFQFTDRERFIALNANARDELFDVLEEVIADRLEVTTILRGRLDSLFHQRAPSIKPIVHSDNESSRRFTILDIVADDRLGLLYRVSRAISSHRCDIELVLIATEGHKAVDVFHVTKAGAKLPDEERRELTADLQRLLEGGYEAG